MFCKNCGKEIKYGDAFCRECGTKNEQGATEVNAQIDTTAFQSAMSNSSGTAVAVKKKSKGKFIIIGVFVVLIIIVIACAIGGNNCTTIEADNYNGMSFDYDISEWCDNFNSALKEVSDEFETDCNIKLTKSSFELDETDYDTTSANVVRYYYNSNDFALSLYVDTDTKKVCKCSVVSEQLAGVDLTMFITFSTVPAIMATTHVDYDTALSIFREKVVSSSETSYTYYNDNIFYQFSSNNNYDIFEIQAVSQEIYDKKYSVLFE